jgi:hypothetical protein
MKYVVIALLGAIGGVAAVAGLNRTTFGRTILGS